MRKKEASLTSVGGERLLLVVSEKRGVSFIKDYEVKQFGSFQAARDFALLEAKIIGASPSQVVQQYM